MKLAEVCLCSRRIRGKVTFKAKTIQSYTFKTTFLLVRKKKEQNFLLALPVRRSRLPIVGQPCLCARSCGSTSQAVMAASVLSLQGMANGEIFPNCLMVTAARHCFYTGRCLWWRKMELTSGMASPALLVQKARISWREWMAEESRLGTQGFA